MNFTAIDFETANEKRTSACAIGLVIVENGKPIKAISRLIKPEPDYFSYRNIQVHGITPEMVENEPTFDEVWEDIKPFIQGKNIIAHNAAFDMGVLKTTLNHYEIELPNLNYFCTYLMTKKALPGFTNYKLPTVSSYYGIELNHHNALSDSNAAAKIMLGLCNEMGAKNPHDLAQIIDFKVRRSL